MENAAFDRIEKLLALILIRDMKGASLKEKIYQLNLAGFTNLEIADIVEAKSNVVASSLYEYKKSKAKVKKKTSKS